MDKENKIKEELDTNLNTQFTGPNGAGNHTLPQSQTETLNQMPHQNYFNQQVMMQPMVKLKKPMKLGWVISLSILVLSIILSVVGGVMMTMGMNTVRESLLKDSEVYKRTTIDSETYEYEGLTPNKEYFLVLSQEAGPEITNVSVGGKSLSSFFKLANENNSKESSLKVYRFVAKSKEVTVEISNVTRRTNAGLSLLDGEKYGGLMSQMVTSLILLSMGFVIGFISFIIFIVFLIIYLVKNSKYKNALRYTSMM